MSDFLSLGNSQKSAVKEEEQQEENIVVIHSNDKKTQFVPTPKTFHTSTAANSQIQCDTSNFVQTKKIENFDEFIIDIKNFENTKKDEILKFKQKSKRSEEKLKKIFVDALISDELNNNEFNREKLKEDMQYQIKYNTINPIEKIEELFKYNPDRKTHFGYEDDFIFNTPLKSNKKTLIYIACCEGKEDILKYLLKKQLNPRIPSIIDDIEETPLECTCRWGYVNILRVLLENVRFSRFEIMKAMKVNGISKGIFSILKRYFKERFKKERVGCFC